jgi:hypothetical protein
MKLEVIQGQVVIDSEREAALDDFSQGRPLPPPDERTLENMLDWFESAIQSIYPRVEQCPEEYIGLVLDRQYLRLVQRGLLPGGASQDFRPSRL